MAYVTKKLPYKAHHIFVTRKTENSRSGILTQVSRNLLIFLRDCLNTNLNYTTAVSSHIPRFLFTQKKSVLNEWFINFRCTWKQSHFVNFQTEIVSAALHSLNTHFINILYCFCALTEHHLMKAYWGSGGITTHSLTSALDGAEWSASRPGRLTPREKAPGTHWIG